MTKKKTKQQDEFYVLMDNVPEYDRSKSYYEQSDEVIEFYKNEERKIREGITIDGVYIHPWLYWHLNFFKTPIPIPNEATGDTKEVIMNPPLDDHFWYFLQNYMRCPKEQKGMPIFGTRGFSKTTTITSLTTWLNTTKENGTLEIIGGDDGDLGGISRLMDISFNQVHPAFLLPRNKSDWTSHIEFGLKTKDKKKIPYSDIFIKNAVKGTSKASEKGAGGSPIGFVVDEIGKFNFLGIYQSGLPAFKTQYGFKCFPILSGTGGNVSLSKDAKKILKNPETFDLLSMDWDILNSMCPKEYRTWTEKKFGIFVPGQMSYRLPVPKVETNLADFLGVKSEYLKKIPMFVTNWKACKEFMESEKIRLKGDADALNKFIMYHPGDPDECFLENNVNPFPVKIARRHLDKLEAEGNIGVSVDIFRSTTEWATKDFSDKERAVFGEQSGECDAPIVVYGNHEFPKEKPPYGMFVSGLDGYKVDVSTYTDSVGTLYTLQRRNTDANTPCEKIVCSYSARPPKMNEFHANCETIVETYNAECCIESIDTHFLQYLDAKGKAYELLAPAVSFGSLNSKRKSQGNTKFGIYPNKANQEYMFALVVAYCKEEHEIDMDDEGNKIVKLGIEFIEDIELLREIINYRAGGNFDRIIAFGHALAWARELDKRGVIPDFQNTKNREIEKHKKKRTSRRPGFYSTRRGKMF